MHNYVKDFPYYFCLEIMQLNYMVVYARFLALKCNMHFPSCSLILLESNYINQKRFSSKIFGIHSTHILVRILSTQKKATISLFIPHCAQQCCSHFLMRFCGATEDSDMTLIPQAMLLQRVEARCAYRLRSNRQLKISNSNSKHADS